MKTKFSFAAMVTLLFLAAAASAWSQATNARVKGTITAGGKPLPDAQVVLTSRDNGRKFKFKTDKNGQFNGYGVPFGPYDEEVFNASGEVVFKKPLQIAAEAGTTENDISVDVSAGGAGQPTVSKEEMERLKAEREKGLSMNALITQYNAAQQAKNWQQAADILKQMIAAEPNHWEYQ